MITTLLRRTIAACAAALLLLGLVAITAPGVAAEEPEDHTGLSRIYGQIGTAKVDVRFYQKAEDESWELFKLVRTKGSYTPYEAWVPPGTYRITFNEFDDGTSNWDVFLPSVWNDGNGDEELVIGPDQTRNIGSQGQPPYRGGTAQGTIRDQCGYTASGKVDAYPADEFTPQPMFETYFGSGGSGNAGEYRIQTGGPTKLRFTLNNGGQSWLGGPSFADATPLTVEPNTTSYGNDLIITRPLKMLGNEPKVHGSLKTPEDWGHEVPDVTVRFYRATGNAADPWVLEKTAHTARQEGSTYESEFRTDLPVGIYRISANEFDDGSAGWHFFKPSFYWGKSSFDESEQFCAEAGEELDRGFHMQYRGGVISGKVTDARGNPVVALVEAYDATDPGAPEPSARTLAVYSDSNGKYSINGASGRTKLRFTHAPYDAPVVLLPEWYGNAKTFATGSAIQASDGQNTSGVNVVLADMPLTEVSKPRIIGQPKLGARVRTEGAQWFPPNQPKTYQWYTKVGSKSTAIRGATTHTYELRASELGKKIFVRVTANPRPNHPGVTKKSADSPLYGPIKRVSSLWAAPKSSGSKFTVTSHVKFTGLSKPSGSLTIRYAKAVAVGGGYYEPSGTVVTKKIKFTKGVGSLSWYGKKGYYIYEITYGGSSTTLSIQKTYVAKHS